MAATFFLCPILLSKAQAQGLTPSAKYHECTALVSSAPKDALHMADDWILRENTPTAQHCRALALFALQRYRDAAHELERLSSSVSQDNRTLWVNIIRQAAQAWLQDGQTHRATAALTRAILTTNSDAHSNHTMNQLTTDMLMERSALYLRDGKTMEAVQDVDNAISLQPDDSKLRLARAKLFIAMKEYALAKDDLSVILASHPKHPEASRLLSSLQ